MMDFISIWYINTTNGISNVLDINVIANIGDLCMGFRVIVDGIWMGFVHGNYNDTRGISLGV